ncbi:peroxiredoxin [Candidatus Woesearchaeota archaeon]|nr:peroxiredoxin [Candidatus Woesearchaeota archaeon]MBI2130656.1 peroxiredoxin [Candidatus Woesearchaeota archaeon]MBI2660792.1 peroxiredoxin [Candidatus Woesearchaeota archaeon]
MVNVGDKAPDFKLKDQNQNEVSLSSFHGKNVLLAFYPFDFSPVCTTEFACFQDDLSELGNLGVQVLGISVDSHWSHKAFADKLGLKFPLLSDFGKEASKYYGVLRQEGFSERAYFLIDKHGIIKFRKVMPTLKERMENSDLIAEIKK